MSKFFALKVKKIQKETPSCVSVSFDIPAEIKETFRYKQGQYLTFRLFMNAEELRRSYSICSNPLSDEDLVVAVKKVQGGRVSAYFNDTLQVGDTVEVMPPMGNFYAELNSAHQKNYVLFAGGSGITPMLSIISATLQAEPQSRLHLFYGNLDEVSTIFKKNLEDLSVQFAGRFEVHFIYDKPQYPSDNNLYSGILDGVKVSSILDTFSFPIETEYFICGPAPMMDFIVKALESRSVASKFVHVEYFSAPVDASKEELSAEEIIDSQMVVICDGDEVPVFVKAGQSVLEAALAMHLDAPYSCRAGSCCTCRAKLVEGKVKMKVNYSLLEEEVAEGFILTCQSYPLTSTLVVDYDRGR